MKTIWELDGNTLRTNKKQKQNKKYIEEQTKQSLLKSLERNIY
jgi:hypothetical protein